MSCGTSLKFQNKASGMQFVSSFPKGRIGRHNVGTFLRGKNDMLIGAHCSSIVQDETMSELMLVYKEIEKCHEFLTRGNDVANVCANFAVTGLKEDNNTKLLMTHVPKHKGEKPPFREMHMRSKLRSIFMKKIYPLVKQEFGWLFEPINNWLKMNRVRLYAHFVTGVTAGKLFWPQSHTDPDAWFTVLVCQDYGQGIILATAMSSQKAPRDLPEISQRSPREL